MEIKLLILFALFLGIALGYLIRFFYSKLKFNSVEQQTKELLKQAQLQAEAKIKEGLLEVKEQMENSRKEFEKETRERKQELITMERRLNQREENLERKADIIERKEKNLIDRERKLSIKENKIDEELKIIEIKKQEQTQILEKITSMTQEEAKKILFKQYEEEVRKESALMARSIEQEAKETAEKKAKEILAIAIQRIAADHTSEVTTVNIPITDEMKGRVIGREGRNIRSFEQATGVELIVDDSPETITISAFDPIRREIARLSLEKLISDGRIHPARIEEVVNKVKNDMDNFFKDIGEKAALEAGIVRLPVEILKLLGKLKVRTSYGQNQLQHTLEVVYLASTIAGELGADINFCKKAALLHDIGKAIDHNVEGTHHQISADIAKKYGESPKMINAILAHHEDIAKPESLEAFIIAAADAISASRPGARRGTTEYYVKRIEKLEQIASSFKGVTNAYAIQAGREIRIMVEPEQINDASAYLLAKDISKKIEQELEYPGQIKVVVIRELRAQELAK